MDLDPSIVWDFAGEVVGTLRPASRAVPATVTRIDADGTVWATVGDGMEAPAASSSVGLSVGDEVSVQWSGNAMSVVGNTSSPAPSGRAFRAVERVASAARELAKDAQAVAEATGQYFWHDSNGAHVSTEQGNPTSAQNTLWNSLGMLFRSGSNNLLAIVTGADPGMDVYDGQGNADANTVASFRGSGARVGRAGGYHTEITSTGMSVSDGTDDVVRIHSEVTQDGIRYGSIDIGKYADGTLTRVGGSTDDYTEDDYVYHRRSADLTAVASTESDGAWVEAWAEHASTWDEDSTGITLCGEQLDLMGENGHVYASVSMEDAGKVISAQSGSVGQTTGIAANGYHDFDVTFAREFATVPNVLLTIYTTSTATTFNCDIYLRAKSTTGFTARIVNREGTGRSPGFQWLAIG